MTCLGEREETKRENGEIGSTDLTEGERRRRAIVIFAGGRDLVNSRLSRRLQDASKVVSFRGAYGRTRQCRRHERIIIISVSCRDYLYSRFRSSPFLSA